MSSRLLQLVFVAVLLFGMTAWAQSSHYAVPAASIDEQFAAYHDALSDAADNLLTAPSAQRQAGHTQEHSELASSQSSPDAIHRFAASYWNGQDANVRQAIERVGSLRPLVEPILREEGVPTELAAIMLVESGGRTTAFSPKGARGPWQFMPETARRYGLAVSPVQDDRIDLHKSTRAAARYLRDLYELFGDWHLAFAAYNGGENMVQRAIERTGSRDFMVLTQSRLLPAETRNYVPAVLSAVKLLGSDPHLALAGRKSNFRDDDHPGKALGQRRRVLFADAAPGN